MGAGVEAQKAGVRESLLSVGASEGLSADLLLLGLTGRRFQQGLQCRWESKAILTAKWALANVIERLF